MSFAWKTSPTGTMLLLGSGIPGRSAPSVNLLWPLSSPATPTLTAITAGSASVETPTTSAQFVTAWETLSSGSGGTIDASGVTDVEGTLNIANGGSAAVVVQGGSYKNLTLTNVQNLRFENMEAVTTPRATNATRPPNVEISLSGCNNIQFIDFNVTYDTDDAIKTEYYNSTSANFTLTPNGWISLDNGCYDILFDGGYIEGFFTAFTINSTSALGVIEVLNTEITKTQNDDFRGGAMKNVRVEGCYQHDHFPMDYRQPDGQHSDMFQCWALAGQVSENITIKNNIMKAGSAGGQGIFFNIDADGQINNVLVENNLIYNSHFHGISFFAGVSGSTITRNTVLENTEALITSTSNAADWPSNPTVQDFTPGIRDASGGNTITDNVCLVVETGVGTVSTGNYIVTYGAGGTATDAINHFENPYEGADATLTDLKMKTGSSLFGSKGSTLL